MFKFYLSICVTILICGCASTPRSYPPLEQAKTELEKIKSDESIHEVASVTLYEADEEIKLAESAITENNLSKADHHIYLAVHKQEIAQELLLKHQQEEELTNLKQQQLEMIAQARRNETNRASSETRKAQQRVQQLEQALGQYKAEETRPRYYFSY